MVGTGGSEGPAKLGGIARPGSLVLRAVAVGVGWSEVVNPLLALCSCSWANVFFPVLVVLPD